MPILTIDQIVEAAFELNEADRHEVIERLVGSERPLELSEEYKAEIKRRIEAHHLDPSKTISREQLMVNLDALQ